MSSYPEILYNNILADADLTATYEETEYPINNLKDGIYWSYYRTDTGSTEVVVDLSGSVTVNALGLAACELANVAGTIQLEGWNGASYDMILAATAVDQYVKYFTFADAYYPRYRITFSTAANAYIGALYLGQKFTLIRPIAPSYAPAAFETRYVLKQNVSEAGFIISQSRTRAPVRFRIVQVDVDPVWVQTSWYAAVDVMRRKSFFYLWNPSYQPDDVVFGELDKKVTPASYTSIIEGNLTVNARGIIS